MAQQVVTQIILNINFTPLVTLVLNENYSKVLKKCKNQEVMRKEYEKRLQKAFGDESLRVEKVRPGSAIVDYRQLDLNKTLSCLQKNFTIPSYKSKKETQVKQLELPWMQKTLTSSTQVEEFTRQENERFQNETKRIQNEMKRTFYCQLLGTEALVNRALQIEGKDRNEWSEEDQILYNNINWMINAPALAQKTDEITTQLRQLGIPVSAPPLEDTPEETADVPMQKEQNIVELSESELETLTFMVMNNQLDLGGMVPHVRNMVSQRIQSNQKLMN